MTEPHSSGDEQLLGATLLNTPRVASIERLTAVDSVRARVILAVDLGLISPGDKLPPAQEMAEAFGVSPSTVIRGLTQLQVEGLLVRRAGRYGGTYVHGVPTRVEQASADGANPHAAVQPFLEDYSTVHELIDERAVLEAGFAALAAGGRTDAQLSQLTELIDRMDETQSWAAFRNLDRAFHQIVVAAARTPLAEDLAARVNAALDPYFLPYNMALLHASNHGHRAIHEALRTHDTGEAARLTAEHIQELHGSMYVALSERE